MKETAYTFDLALKTADVILSGKKFQIREFTGKQREEYFAKYNKRTKQEGEESKLVDTNGFYSEFLSSCLYDEAGKLVTAEEVDNWPSRVQIELHKIGKEVCSLTAQETTEKKD